MKTVVSLVLVSLFLSTYALYEGDSAVKLLNEDTFQKMLKSKGMWLVEFFSPQCGHCVQAAPEYEKGAKILQGIIHFGAVDATRYPSLAGQYGIKGYPTFKFFGDQKQNPTDYNSQRSAQEFVQYCLSQTKEIVNQRANGQSGKSGNSRRSSESRKTGGGSKSSKGGVIELDDASFESQVLQSEDAWFVKFYSPSCGHCQAMAEDWQKLPSLMKSKVKIAKIDATVHKKMAQKFGIRGFPTLLFFPLGANKEKVPYEGQRSAEDMAAWLNTQKIAEQKRELLELSEQSLNKECDSNNVCILVLLENKSELPKLAFLKTLMKKHVSEPIKYFYTTNKLSQLQNDLMIADRSSPKILSVWPKSNSYKILNGQVNESGVEEWLGKIFGSRGWFKFQKKYDEYLFEKGGREL